MKVYRDTQDGGVLLEDSQDCPTGHYSYMYAYGNTQIDIGGYTFEHHWQDEDWREFWQNVTNCTQLLKKGFQNARQND